MEQGLQLWKQLFGRVREVDYEEFNDRFHDFVKQYGDCDLDEYQMRYIRELIDPDRQFRVSISDFLIFFTSYWNVPSKRKLVFNYEFKINEENEKKSHNDLDYIELTIQNKYQKSEIVYLQTGSTIDIFRDKVILNKSVEQDLNKLDVLKMGSSTKKEINDIVFPDTYDIYPIHCKIGIGTTGYYVKDQSKKMNRMRFIIGEKKPLVLDYKMVFEIGSSGCRFAVRKIYPEPTFDEINMNFVSYIFTGQYSLEAELQDFQNRSQTKMFHNVKEWREEQIQIKKNQKNVSQTGTTTDPIGEYCIEIDCIEGELKGQTYTLKGNSKSLTIGRDKQSDVQVKHISAAQNHAVIYFNKTYGIWVLKEQQKTLGTYVYLANYDQYVNNTHSNFHLIQSGLSFELHNYIFHPRLVYKKLEEL
ncbi:hypothetical protein ABPG74_022752 [Tetrahymena malaccensis]